MVNATEMLARLNAMLDAENEKDEPNSQLVSDLCLLIAGNTNPAVTADQFTLAAFRVFPFLGRRSLDEIEVEIDELFAESADAD